MTYIRSIPSPPLNAYIDDIYYLDGPAVYPRQKAFPVASSNLMINLGDPFNVYAPEQDRPFMTCVDSWWVGVWDTYHSVAWPAHVQLYGVHFKPDGTYPFLQLPLSELNRQVVSLDAIWGGEAYRIQERLSAARSAEAGFKILEQLLLERLTDAPYGLRVVKFAVSAISHVHGALSIRALSDQLGISQNHLGNQFKRFVGVPPKEVARFYRFANALRLLQSAQKIDLTSIAHQSQFYDQSHFNRDFMTFTGHSPGEYLQLHQRVESENPDYARTLNNNLPID